MLSSPTFCDCMTNGRIDSRVIAVNYYDVGARVPLSHSDPPRSSVVCPLCTSSHCPFILFVASQVCPRPCFALLFVCVFFCFNVGEEKISTCNFSWVSICVCHRPSVCLFVPCECNGISVLWFPHSFYIVDVVPLDCQQPKEGNGCQPAQYAVTHTCGLNVKPQEHKSSFFFFFNFWNKRPFTVLFYWRGHISAWPLIRPWQCFSSWLLPQALSSLLCFSLVGGGVSLGWTSSVL